MGTFEATQKSSKSEEKQAVAIKPKTKRQRRKDQHNSDKNKWLIQHPKIQSMERREQIYIKDAGLNETKAEKRQAPIDPKLDLMSPEVKFGRILAGTDQRKRHAAVKKLKAYLKARCDVAEVVDGDSDNDENSNGGISELDLLKLWKALWYTLYMADKKPVQDELSKHICKLLWCVVGTEEEDEYAGRAYLEMTEAEERELPDDDDEYDVTLEELENTLNQENNSDHGEDSEESENEEEGEEGNKEIPERKEEGFDEMMEMEDCEILHCRGAHLVSLFIRTFFRTIRRDWGSMDKYRIDKFYTLIRLMMHEVYEYMSVRSWNYGIVLLLNDAIFEEVLKEPPNGLRYHLIDLCLEELAKVSSKAKEPLTEATFLNVLEPFFGLSQTGRNDDTVQERVMEKVMDNFLENYCVVSDNAIREDNVEDMKEDGGTSLIFMNVHVKTIAEFLFTLGSDPDTKDKYRKSLYDLHKKFMRRLKKIGKDVAIAIDEDGNEIYDDDNVGSDSIDDLDSNVIDKSIPTIASYTHEEMPSSSENVLKDGDIHEPVDPVKTESKKKKKKKRKSMDQGSVSEPDVTPIESDDKANKKKTKKKKNSVPEEATADEEIVITVLEQQDAKKRERKEKRKLKEQEEMEKVSAKIEEDETGSKRVSFGKKNRAKSHKASMKALRTSNPPSTKEVTPVKGILRKELKHKSKLSKTNSSGLSKKQRRKASSYF